MVISVWKEINCDYKYLIDNKRKNKSNFKNKNLETNLTESNQMKENGFYRIWDAGKIKFEMIL